MNRIHLIAAVAALGLAAATPASAKANAIQSPSAALAQGSSFAWAPVPARGLVATAPPTAPPTAPAAAPFYHDDC